VSDPGDSVNYTDGGCGGRYGTLFLKNVQFITGISPAKVTCRAYYKVKKT
jgi:hypothetical protein